MGQQLKKLKLEFKYKEVMSMLCTRLCSVRNVVLVHQWSFSAMHWTHQHHQPSLVLCQYCMKLVLVSLMPQKVKAVQSWPLLVSIFLFCRSTSDWQRCLFMRLCLDARSRRWAVVDFIESGCRLLKTLVLHPLILHWTILLAKFLIVVNGEIESRSCFAVELCYFEHCW